MHEERSKLRFAVECQLMNGGVKELEKLPFGNYCHHNSAKKHR